ncbi:MAG: hypothetical protein HY329_02315 [Chloroflexi bacterium]|nr:hypothetical protein [Chloroflexota bacterium]
MQHDLSPLPRVLERLYQRTPTANGVLSAYLSLTPTPGAQRPHLLLFRDGCKMIRGNLPVAEREVFDGVATKAERYLEEELVPSHPGLALFVASDDARCEAVPLPEAPNETVVWDDRPHLAPLQELLDDYERVAVLLFDKERARLFTIFLGELEYQESIEDEVPGKQATGDWYALSQTRYARHHEDHVLRHAKRAIAMTMAALRARPFERLLVGGPAEAVALLKHHLPRPLRARLAGTLRLEVFASDAEVLEVALRAAAEIERRREVELVRELVDAATTPHVALGLDATLAALRDGRVHALIVATDGFSAKGRECRTCGRLVSDVDGCPFCGGPTHSLADLRERLIEVARAQSAKTELVSGEAAGILVEHGGVGSWTRY